MPTHCVSSIKEIQTLQGFKQQNEHYWKIIENQRIIIQTLQKTITNLTNGNGNEQLVKINTELDAFAPVVYPTPGFDSLHVTHPSFAEISINAVENATPIPPPRSPYHQNQDLPKRPPVLKLTVSNYALRPGAHNTMDRDYLVSPGRHVSHHSSPRSVTSAGSSNEVHSDDSSKYSTSHRTSLTTASPPQQDYTRNQRRESANQYERGNKHRVDTNSKSEPSTPMPRTPRFDSLMPSDATAVLSNLSNIQVKVISSSIDTDEKGKDFPVFVIGIQQKDGLQNEIWRIKKSLIDLIHLDVNLKEYIKDLKRLPDKSFFTTHAPAKVDERKTMIEKYLQHAITSNLVILCDFLSSDRIYNSPMTLTNEISIRQGYLTKRGKNFGGWKSRYFVLDNTGVLEYFDSKDGQFLGTIKLADSQIGCHQTNRQDLDSSYRHAFLILEPKSNGASTRHIFCADSDQDRDLWVEALLYYTNQVHVTEDTLNSLFHNDMMMGHLVVEPSSSTDSTILRGGLKKRCSMDYIFSYFQGPSSINTSPKEDASEEEEETTTPKKSKHRTSNKKPFWGKKMFGGHHSEIIPSSTSPHHGIALGSPHDIKYIQQAEHDETRGENQVFGIPLGEAVRVARVYDQYELPAIVHRCIEYMETKGALVEEGIYRLSGSATLIKNLKKRFNHEGDVKLLEDKKYLDVHAIAGLLKMWLRELPENILTEALLGDFLRSIIDFKDHQSKVFEIGRLVSFLPLVNYTLLRSLCAHLIRVIENSDKTKMTLLNISIVFSATLAISSGIFHLLLVEFDYIFWTDRCCTINQDRLVPATEDTNKIYMQDQVPTLVQNFRKRQDSASSRTRRNSIHYQDNTPKDFISLEKQFNAVIDHIGSPYGDEPYYSDGELKVAYFASRYTANSKSIRQSLEAIRAAI